MHLCETWTSARKLFCNLSRLSVARASRPSCPANAQDSSTCAGPENGWPGSSSSMTAVAQRALMSSVTKIQSDDKRWTPSWSCGGSESITSNGTIHHVRSVRIYLPSITKFGMMRMLAAEAACADQGAEVSLAPKRGFARSRFECSVAQRAFLRVEGEGGRYQIARIVKEIGRLFMTELKAQMISRLDGIWKTIGENAFALDSVVKRADHW